MFFSFGFLYTLDAKIRKSNKLGENFFEFFFDRIGFQWDGDVFYGLKPLARNNALYGADASVRERDEGDGMECPGKGRRGTRWHRGDGKKGGAIFYGCSGAICFPLRYRNGHWQFFHIRNDKKMGVDGVNGFDRQRQECRWNARREWIWVWGKWVDVVD